MRSTRGDELNQLAIRVDSGAMEGGAEAISRRKCGDVCRSTRGHSSSDCEKRSETRGLYGADVFTNASSFPEKVMDHARDPERRLF